MAKVRIVALFFLLSVSLNPTLYAASADVQAINGKDYYPAVKEALQEAEKSIHMVMYQVALHSPDKNSKVYKLVDELIKAHHRGVIVKVILDQNVDFINPAHIETWQVEGKNAMCFNLLKKAGIDAQYDNATSYAHAKTIVIDKEIVIMGSSNWSSSAFDRNTETNVLIKSKELAKDLISYFDEIKIGKDAAIPDSNYVPISWEFLENPKLAGRMLRQQDRRAFDVYLLILRRHCEEAERNEADEAISITFDYDKIAEHLGMTEQMNRTAYRRQLIKTLRKLEKRYKLIKFEPTFGKDATITLLSYDDPKKPYSAPKEWFFKIPEEFWTYGWDQKLSFPASYCYLINLAYVSISDDRPWWYSNREVLAERFNTTKGSISKGMTELRRLNLIDVEYGTPMDDDYSRRMAKSYKLMPLYDPKWLDSEWERLKNLYGQKQLDKARNYAKIVFRENDPEDVEEIIIAMKVQGKKAVKEAFSIVAKKAIDNPKRNYAYVKGIINRMQPDSKR